MELFIAHSVKKRENTLKGGFTMKKTVTGLFIILLLSIGFGKDTADSKNKIPDRQSDFIVGVGFIPEMDYIPEIDSWKFIDTTKNTYAEDIKKAQLDWKEKKNWLQGKISATLVRSLSRWAKKEMKKYKKVPALPVDITLKPVRRDEQNTKVVFESTLDTLPTHSSLVTRWLKVIILYDRLTDTIIKVTFTIRGEILE